MSNNDDRPNISVSVGRDNWGDINVANTINQLRDAGLTPVDDPAAVAMQWQLFQVLAGKFSAEELRELCLELGLDYDDLGGEGKRGKARAMVEYHTRRDWLPALEERVRALRPAAFEERSAD